MLIDCDTCIARPVACGSCAVSHLLSVTTRPPDSVAVPRLRLVDHGPAARPVAVDDESVAAMATLAAAGLVPPLRLQSRVG